MFWKREVPGFCVVSPALWGAAVNVAQAQESFTVELAARAGRFYRETFGAPAVEQLHSDEPRRERGGSAGQDGGTRALAPEAGRVAPYRRVPSGHGQGQVVVK